MGFMSLSSGLSNSAKAHTSRKKQRPRHNLGESFIAQLLAVCHPSEALNPLEVAIEGKYRSSIRTVLEYVFSEH